MVWPIALLVVSEVPSSLAKWEAGEEARYSAATAAGPNCLPVGLRAACGRATTALEGAVRQLCGRSWLAPALGSDARQQQEGETHDCGAEAALAALAAPASRQPPLLLVLEQRRQPAVRLDGWRRGLAWWLLLSFLWGASVAVA